MEDRYLFKAKRLDTHDWILGFLSMHKTGKYFIRPISGSALCSVEVEKNTICQCTGRKDKNKNLIWENDTVRVKYSDGYEEIADVYYEGSKYFPFSNEYACEDCNSYCLISKIEVIGNIFDNPELLESEG